MKISIIHPSRSRPQQAAATAKAWLSSAKDREKIEYIFSIDTSDPMQRDYILLEMIPGSKNRMLISDNNSAIEAINNAALGANLFDLLIVVSDDFNTPPYHWDEALRIALAGKSDYLVKTQDGLQPWIITLPIMDRVYYERFGYVYNPAYKHLFCDCELAHVGEMLGKTITLPLVIKHNHYCTGKTPKDAINQKNDATWSQGESVYLDRLLNNFGLSDNEIVNPPNKVPKSHLDWIKSKGVTFIEKALE